MLEHLKSLPLTIFLTILIWMYAEAQFTATQEGIVINLHAAAPTTTTPTTSDYVVRFYDPSDRLLHNSIPVTITFQGPQSTVARIHDAIVGKIGGAEDFTNQTCILKPDQIRPDGDDTLDILTALNALPYFRSRGLVVTAASPAVARYKVERVMASREFTDVPIYLNAPPDLLDQYEVELRPKSVNVTLAGTAAALENLAKQFRVTLDLGPGDRPAAPATAATAPANIPFTRRTLRYQLPDGLQSREPPPPVEFRLLPRTAATTTK